MKAWNVSAKCLAHLITLDGLSTAESTLLWSTEPIEEIMGIVIDDDTERLPW